MLTVCFCYASFGQDDDRVEIAETRPQVAQAWAVTLKLEKESNGQIQDRRGAMTLQLATDTVLIELGAIRVFGRRAPDGVVVVAWHTHDPSTYFTTTGHDLGLLLRQVLPPLWSGPLARWLTDNDDAYPLVGHDWPARPSVTADESNHLRSFTVGDLTVQTPAIDAWGGDHGQVLTESVTTGQVDGTARLRLTYQPIEPLDVDSWCIETEGRSRVSQIRALRAQPAQVQPGQQIEEFRLFDQDRAQVEFQRAFEPERTPRGDRFATALMLVLERSVTNTSQSAARSKAIIEQIAQAREQLAIQAATHDRPRPLLVVRAVQVVQVSEFSQAGLDDFVGRWSQIKSDALLEQTELGMPKVLWTHPPRETIDLFAPGAHRVAILIDRSGQLVAVHRFDDAKNDLTQWVIEAVAALDQFRFQP